MGTNRPEKSLQSVGKKKCKRKKGGDLSVLCTETPQFTSFTHSFKTAPTMITDKIKINFKLQ